MLASFDYAPRTRIVFGPGCVQRVGALAREFEVRRVLLVTDPGLVAAGHAARVQAILQESQLKVAVFDQVCENPTTRCADAALETARELGAEALIGLGGGSALDTAKACNFLLTNGGRLQDYWGVGKASKPMLPLLAIPTTAGTGSECQSAALITDEVTHQKMACLDPKAAPRIALLDPELTLSQPGPVTAHTGVDAIAHAVESAVTKRRNPLSLMHAHQAFQLLVPALPQVVSQPHNLAARSRMLLGAALAGCAVETSMLGATHSAANPLTAHFGIPHGEAVGLLLPAVVRFNSQSAEARLAYAQLASAPEIACVSEGLEPAVEALIQHLDFLLNTAGFPASLAAHGVKPEDLPGLAAEAAGQWTAAFNPRPVTAQDFAALYRQALEPRGPGRNAFEPN
jgi:alcohol dehydrogenase